MSRLSSRDVVRAVGRAGVRAAGRSARRIRRRLAPVVAAAAVGALVLSGCATNATGATNATNATNATSATTATSAGATIEGALTIYAAASLAGAFDEIAAAFAAEHPRVDIRPITYDGSSTLATQLIEGAPADVFAAADEANLQKVVAAGRVEGGSVSRFATNTLVIVVPAGNPGGIASLEALADPGQTIVLCDAQVPCGAASARLLELADVTATPASLEQSVTGVLTKVAAGEADAGLAYASDVVGRHDVDSVVPEHAGEVVNRYPIAAIDGASAPDVARAFIAYVLGAEAQAVLERRGFGRP